MQHERFHYRTLDELKEKAKELGTTYGKVVLGLQLGTIDRW